MKKIDAIIGILCVINGVRIIALKMQNEKQKKHYSDIIDNLVNGEGKRDSIISGWYLDKKISHDMYYEYCERRNKND